VVARLLIFGVNPVDLEGVLARLESVPLLNAKMLETRWLSEWGALAQSWERRASDALLRGYKKTAYVCRFHASVCNLARFLVNTADMTLKRAVYSDFAQSHRETLELLPTPVNEIDISCEGQFKISAQLYLPEGEGPHPCVVVFAGLGSCKEEMVVLARALVERGLAALVPDMPGCGATLWSHGVSCSMNAIEQAIDGLARFVVEHSALDDSALGAVGLCMGGGYAYRAASIDQRFRYVATLFPLFINQVATDSIPQWMRSGPWTAKQTGGADVELFIKQMGAKPTDAPKVPFFMVHGRYDNWMTWDAANALFERVQSPDRELLTIENSPVITGGNATTHAMPVGEQMHWVVPLVADWLACRALPLMTPNAAHVMGAS
jgi:dienelactone hydrolase